MKRLVLALIAFSISFNFWTQNLVPNGSFEQIDCPDNWMTPHVFGADQWYNPNQSSPDLYSLETVAACHVSIFNNGWQDTGEWQYPQDGETMIGLVHYIHTTCIREHVSCRLIEPLEEGVTYTASMYVSRSNTSTGATDCIGMYFSQDSLSDISTTCGFDVTPQVSAQSEVLLTDTTSWILIQGDFVADGGEQFLLIGNVAANSECVFDSPDPEVEFINAYYFIDNVSLISHSTVDQPQMDSEEFVLYPNPVQSTLQVSASLANRGYRLYDAGGRLQANGLCTDTGIDVQGLKAGLYFMQIDSDLGPIRKSFLKSD
jgi:hypothetical protein